MTASNPGLVCAAAISVLLGFRSAEALTFNANTSMKDNMTQGSPTNPYTDAQGGVWTYGRSASVADGTVTPLDSQVNEYTVCFGFKPSDVSHPLMVVNTGTEDVSNYGLPVVPGEMVIHPYQGGTDMPYAVLRFVVPSAGIYNVAATFRDLSSGGFWGGGHGVDVHVVVNGHDVDHATVDVDSALPAYTANVRLASLAAGDTVDFVVGPNGSFAEAYWNDSTGFSAAITKVATAFSANTAMKTNLTQSSPTNPYTDAQGGVWTYGRSASAAGGTVIPLDARNDVSSACLGFKPSDNSHPEMYVNTGTGNDSTFGLPIVPGEIDVHPFTGGTATPYAVLRFAAPSAGTYNVAATFRDLASGGGNGGHGVDVHVVINGQDVDHATIDVDGAFPSHTANLRLVTLAAGDTVDFVVGPNGSAFDAYYCDSTGIFAAITEQVPSMPEIINLDINGYNYVRDGDPVPVSGDTYSGGARIGSLGDYWNSVGVGELTVTNFAAPNLKLADGTTDTSVRFSMNTQGGALLSSDRIPSQWVLNPLLNDYLVVTNQSYQFTISGLTPNATYDIYFYCGAGIFSNGGLFGINGASYASDLQWFFTGSGADLAVCIDQTADSSGSITGTFSSRDNVSGTLAGLQIAGTFPRRSADIVNIDFNGYTPGVDPEPGAGDTYTGAGQIGGTGDFWNGVSVASGGADGFTMPKLKLADGITNSMVTFGMSQVGGGAMNADRIESEYALNTLLNDYLTLAEGVTNRFTITGLVPGAKYDLYFYCAAGIFANPGRVVIDGATYDSIELGLPGVVQGVIKGAGDHAVCPGIVADSNGSITGDFCKTDSTISQGVLSGLQIVGKIPRIPQGTLISVR